MSSKTDLQQESPYRCMSDRIHWDPHACVNHYAISSRYTDSRVPPLTLAEAMASGLPCIVSDIPNLADIVEDANCGIAVVLDDIKQAGEKLIGYLERRHMNHTDNARSYTVQTLDWSLLAERDLVLFQGR